MRCDCCDRELNDSEATAKFVEPDGSKPTRYVGMCKECQSFMPPEIKIVSKPTKKGRNEEPELRDYYDLEDYSDDDESWQ